MMEGKKYSNNQAALLETIEQQKQIIENISNELLDLKETLKIYNKKIKLLKHDVYFLKKENSNLNENNIYLKIVYYSLTKIIYWNSLKNTI